MSRPKQVYIVEIELPEQEEFGTPSRELVFPVRPTKDQILSGVRAQNAFYTDHGGFHPLYEKAVQEISDINPHGGWGRALPWGAYVRLREEDYFP